MAGKAGELAPQDPMNRVTTNTARTRSKGRALSSGVFVSQLDRLRCCLIPLAGSRLSSSDSTELTTISVGVMETQLAVIGGGPGGYAAAFLAADLGVEVPLVHDEPRLGGGCPRRPGIPPRAR